MRDAGHSDLGMEHGWGQGKADPRSSVAKTASFKYNEKNALVALRTPASADKGSANTLTNVEPPIPRHTFFFLHIFVFYGHMHS